MDIKKLLGELTLEEKASLCSGRDFWSTQAVERLGIPSIVMTDGPHGLRKQAGASDHLGISDSVPATCFPTAAASACSWDVDLLLQMGTAIAEECLQEDVSVVLGPGANIKRSPLCGRNFEYFSEDPYLSGELAAAMIDGVQSKGIGTSLKHYTVNNQETRRMTIDAVVDERAKREIYLAGFERAVKKAQPFTVMCSYNRVDGTYLSENERLLTKVLRDEWGFDGMTVTDWGACNDRVAGIKAGMDLEMPSSHGRNSEKIIAAVNSGMLTIEELDSAVTRVLELVEKAVKAKRADYRYDKEAHHALARKIAQNASVLLKNDGLLPLSKQETVGIIGEFAKTPRYQGAGSSLINPSRLENVCEVLTERNMQYRVAAGYNLKNGKPDEELIREAVETARSVKTAVIFAGLTEDYESEGFDRQHMRLPDSHAELIKRVAEANPNVVVVLQNGAPVEMPWAGNVKAILECYLGGQAGASAAVDILYGDVNPSGKLAETFPQKLEDNPSYGYFPGGPVTVEYRESIYVGYRYYDKAQKGVLFPFGHGLSYTTFEYTNLTVKKTDALEYEVSAVIKNTGARAGAEIVQLYVKNNDSSVFKAEKELRAFSKVYLEPGEEKTVSYKLGKRDFAYYNVDIADWHVDSGVYEILVGASSRDIRLSGSITIEAGDDIRAPYSRKELPGLYKLNGGSFTLTDTEFVRLLGRENPKNHKAKGDPFDRSTALCDIQHKAVGRFIYKQITKGLKQQMSAESDERTVRMFESIVGEMPLRSLELFAGGSLSRHFVDGVVEMVNGHFFRGLALVLKK